MKIYIKKQFKIRSNLAGQTLIETLVAIFMLTMGVSAALGLAIFAFSSSANIAKQIIATGLAREGLEAIKNMRDTNWLQQTNIDINCWNYSSVPPGDLTAYCYKNWLNKQFCLDPTGSNGACTGDVTTNNNVLSFDASNPFYWVKSQITRDASHGYGLVFDPTLAGNGGFYSAGINSGGTSGVPCADGATDASGLKISEYCRKITVTKLGAAPVLPPYDQPTEGPILKVQSFVWWVDKKCPRAVDWSVASPTCRLELDMYLTNWKNY